MYLSAFSSELILLKYPFGKNEAEYEKTLTE